MFLREMNTKASYDILPTFCNFSFWRRYYRSKMKKSKLSSCISLIFSYFAIINANLLRLGNKNKPVCFVLFSTFCIFADMKLKFVIHYRTEWGQSLHVSIKYVMVDGRSQRQNLVLQTQDGDTWSSETVMLVRGRSVVKYFEYCYQVEDGDGKVLRKEWNKVKRRFMADDTKSFLLTDQWKDIPLNYHLYTKAYRTIVRKSVSDLLEDANMDVPLFRKTVIFRVSAPQLLDGERVAVVGSHPAIGGWNPTRYMLMQYAGDYEWILSVNVDNLPMPFEYKYVVVDTKTNRLKAWEEGENRPSGDEALSDGQVLVLNGEALRMIEVPLRSAGVVVPVFSLRSDSSYGVGDFGDLCKMVDWAVKTGMHMIQLLPVNDTTTTHTWTDSHPYNIVSNQALHPHYLDLEQLGELKDRDKMKSYHRQRRELNAMDCVDYMAVDKVKSAYVRDVFDERGKETLDGDNFRSFWEKNECWLKDYAVFCVLRDENATANVAEWPLLSVYDPDLVSAVFEDPERKSRIELILFTQYHLYQQFAKASAYARRCGVALKGDLPVGVYRESVETWKHPSLFYMDEQMGTPPDKEMPYGQNWGFPIFKWDSLERVPNDVNDEARLWWHDRVSWIEQFFDALRIDHVLGYFRAWSIPATCTSSMLGHFEPALPMSADEISQFGLPFRKEMMTRPFINESVLTRFFGVHTDYVREHFLVKLPYGLYGLKEEFSTQRNILSYFRERNDEHSEWIREGMMRLVENVLFVEDIHREGMYHPRIMAYNTPVYDFLTSEEKDSFMRLYNNYYYERHDTYWGWQAERLLVTIFGDNELLLCAEDLGMCPKSVKTVLDKCRILTLEVQSMPKEIGFEFAHTDTYPSRSVASFSTHDMSPMRLWWEENPGRTQRYYTTMLQKEGRAPRELPIRIAEEIVARHLYCPSMLCLQSIQDWFAMDMALRAHDVYSERINSPFDSYNQWKFRMSVSLDKLKEYKQFNMKIHTMIERSKRA